MILHLSHSLEYQVALPVDTWFLAYVWKYVTEKTTCLTLLVVPWNKSLFFFNLVLVFKNSRCYKLFQDKKVYTTLDLFCEPASASSIVLSRMVRQNELSPPVCKDPGARHVLLHCIRIAINLGIRLNNSHPWLKPMYICRRIAVSDLRLQGRWDYTANSSSITLGSWSAG